MHWHVAAPVAAIVGLSFGLGVGACSDRKPEAEPCDPCDLERFDGLLRDKIEEECDLPYEFVRGCYVPSEETSNGRCWVAGLYFSNCDPDA